MWNQIQSSNPTLQLKSSKASLANVVVPTAQILCLCHALHGQRPFVNTLAKENKEWKVIEDSMKPPRQQTCHVWFCIFSSRTDTDLRGNQKHAAVFGADDEGQVEDSESVCLAWLQENSLCWTQELTSITIWANQQTYKNYNHASVNKSGAPWSTGPHIDVLGQTIDVYS